MPLGRGREWARLGKEWTKHYRELNRKVSKRNFLAFDKKMFRELGIKEPTRNALPGTYFEIRSPKIDRKKRTKRKNGFRSTTTRVWSSNTKGTKLEGYDMTAERIWFLCFAALYAANFKEPNANRMAKLSGFGRTNSYALLEQKLLPEIRMLERALALPRNPTERAITVVKSLFAKHKIAG